jgi:SAM-dependent methyltransferase
MHESSTPTRSAEAIGTRTTRPRGRTGLRPRALLGAALLPILTGCHVLGRLDYGHLLSRRGWQHTPRVIDTLALRAGDRVADLGAGDGYFSFYFADAVGPEGRVYAVDIDPQRVSELRNRVEERGYGNIEVILADPNDPGLPDGRIDLAFFCNAYHHFEDRVAYLTRLHDDLTSHARIAIVDGKPEGSLFIPEGHMLPEGRIAAELAEAGYHPLETHDFLPLQSFEVFGRDAAHATRAASGRR